MTPLFFGTPQRRLFGVYAPARARATGAKAVVLCHPWGQEYLRAHRSMRHLSNLLSAAGHHVLRFDYFGTGDSAGDMLDADLAGWERDIDTAIQELMDSAGTRRVALVGLRLGATLAARVANRRRREIESLVLWDPVVNGSEYLDELASTEKRQKWAGPQGSPRPAERGGGHEFLGFALSARLEDEIRALDLTAQAAAMPARTFIPFSQALPSHDALRTSLAARPDNGVALEHIESLYAWRQYEEFGAGALPLRVLDRIARVFG